MNDQEKLITQFYTCFQNKDYVGMQQCYAGNLIFTDDAFQSLRYNQARAMWHMLLTSATDLQLTFENVTADAHSGSCRWTATYTFALTNRKVVNKIDTRMEFDGTKIVTHHDRFDFWKWSRQAFGFTGLLLGWTSFFKKKVQTKARQRLEDFIAKHPQYKD